MDTLRMGIAGVGSMGFAHAACIAGGKINGLTLSALCDIDPAARQRAREAFPGIPVFEDTAALCASGCADALLVAAPHYDHPPLACAALKAGLHVLVEKPAGVHTAAVRELNEAAARSGLVFGIMFNQRTNPLFRRARELVAGGTLGRPKRFVWQITNWYRTQSYYRSGSWRATWRGEGGGVLLNQAVHNLDIWQWIFGMPKRVRAFCAVGKWHDIEVEDDATLYGEYENGATALFVTSTGEYPGTNRLEIAGDLGKLVIEDGALRHWRLEQPEREVCFSEEKSFPDIGYATELYTPGEPESGHAGILQNFCDAVLHGEALIAPGQDGIHQLMLSNAAYLSSWTDAWAELPVDEAAFRYHLEERVRRSTPPAPPRSREHGGEGYENRWQVRW